MLRYALRALPWARVGVAVLLVVLALELVSRWPMMWALQPTAVGLLGGAAAWCFDEPAAAVVDTAPRGIAWRTTARGLLVLVLVAVWAALVWHTRQDLFGRAWAIGMQGVGAMLAGAAWSAWRRGCGAANPGTGFALAVVPFAIVWPLMPSGELLPLFPALFETDWGASLRLWCAITAVSALCLGLAMAEAPWWRAGRRNVRRR